MGCRVILFVSLICVFIEAVISYHLPSKLVFSFVHPCQRYRSRSSLRSPFLLLRVHTPPQKPQQQHPSGRRWKSKRKRQTFLPSPVRYISQLEERALIDQLGYVPSNICAVSARSGDCDGDALLPNGEMVIDTSSDGVGRPIAIRSYPLLVQMVKNQSASNNFPESMGTGHHDNCSVTPFPTVYWLSCPHVSKAISELERLGYMRSFQSRLEDNPELTALWHECHEEYALERWNLLSKQDTEWLSQGDGIDDEIEKRKRRSMKDMIKCSGVAGTDHRGLRETSRDRATAFVPSVKCLHSHYAHYRSQMSSEAKRVDGNTPAFNLVGRWTHELLLEHFPNVML